MNYHLTAVRRKGVEREETWMDALVGCAVSVGIFSMIALGWSV